MVVNWQKTFLSCLEEWKLPKSCILFYRTKIWHIQSYMNHFLSQCRSNKCNSSTQIAGMHQGIGLTIFLVGIEHFERKTWYHVVNMLEAQIQSAMDAYPWRLLCQVILPKKIFIFLTLWITFASAKQLAYDCIMGRYQPF